jgi:hypothetical protein
MKHWLIVATAAAALSTIDAPSSAQAPTPAFETRVATPDLTTGKSSARRTSSRSRNAASRARRTSRDFAPLPDLPPGYHRVDHQTGLPNPSIPSR